MSSSISLLLAPCSSEVFSLHVTLPINIVSSLKGRVHNGTFNFINKFKEFKSFSGLCFDYSGRSAAQVTSNLGALGTLDRAENKFSARWRDSDFADNIARRKFLELVYV